MKFSCNHCGKRFVTQEELAIGRVYRIACRCGNSIALRVEASLRDRGTPSPHRPLRAAPPPLPDSVRRRSSASRATTQARIPGPSTRVALGMERTPSRQIAFTPPALPPVARRTCEPKRDSRPAEAAWLHEDPFAPQKPPEPVPVPSREFTLVTGADLATAGHGLARLDPDASAEDADERSGAHWVPLEWAYRSLRKRAFAAGVAGGAGIALLVVALVLAAGTSASVVAVSVPSRAETAVAAPTPLPRKAQRATTARRANSSPAASDRTVMAAAAVPRSRSAEPVNPQPEASMTKDGELEVAVTRSNHRGAVDSVDSTPAPTRADPQEPTAEDAETVAEANRGAPESDDAVEREEGTQGEDAAKPENVAHQADRDSPGRIEPAAADDRQDAEATPADAPTAPEPVSATETIATAKPASD